MSVTKPRTYVIINPVAGASDAAAVRDKIRRALGDRNFQSEIYETSGQEYLPEVVRAAIGRGFELFLAAGGDGTVAGAASGLVGAKVVLGVIPTGTGNVLACELGIPLQIEAAIELSLDKHNIKAIDAMQVEQDYLS